MEFIKPALAFLKNMFSRFSLTRVKLKCLAISNALTVAVCSASLMGSSDAISPSSGFAQSTSLASFSIVASFVLSVCLRQIGHCECSRRCFLTACKVLDQHGKQIAWLQWRTVTYVFFNSIFHRSKQTGQISSELVAVTLFGFSSSPISLPSTT